MGSVKLGSTSNTGGISVVYRNRPPRVTSTASGCIVSNTERMSLTDPIQVFRDTTAPSVGVRRQFDLNPGRSSNFPWLSQIARNYSKFRFLELSVSYVTLSPVTIGGQLEMGILYDSENALKFVTGTFPTYTYPANLSSCGEYLSAPLYAGTKIGDVRSKRPRGAEGEMLVLDCDCTRMHATQPWYVVDPSAPFSSADGPLARLNQTTPAYLNVSTFAGAGIPDNTATVVGTVYVSYRIEFIDPTVASLQ